MKRVLTPEQKENQRLYSKKYYQDHLEECRVKHNRYGQNNKEKTSAYKKQYNADNKEKNKQKYLRRTYNIEYDLLYAKQKGRCAVCHTHQSELRTALCVDHDHKTGRVRGLLCHKCNVGIGQFDDNIKKLFDAIKYLSKGI